MLSPFVKLTEKFAGKVCGLRLQKFNPSLDLNQNLWFFTFFYHAFFKKYLRSRLHRCEVSNNALNTRVATVFSLVGLFTHLRDHLCFIAYISLIHASRGANLC